MAFKIQYTPRKLKRFMIFFFNPFVLLIILFYLQTYSVQESFKFTTALLKGWRSSLVQYNPQLGSTLRRTDLHCHG